MGRNVVIAGFHWVSGPCPWPDCREKITLCVKGAVKNGVCPSCKRLIHAHKLNSHISSGHSSISENEP